MVGYVDGIDWINAEAMRYWSFSSSYTPEKRKQKFKMLFIVEIFGVR